MPRIRIGKYSIELPQNRAARIGIGAGLVVFGGLFGFLPVLGYWMVPVGLVVLATDIAPIRRFNRRAAVAIVGWWKGRKAKGRRGGAGDVVSEPSSPGAEDQPRDPQHLRGAPQSSD